jgi:hypothetical protein
VTTIRGLARAEGVLLYRVIFCIEGSTMVLLHGFIAVLIATPPVRPSLHCGG